MGATSTVAIGPVVGTNNQMGQGIGPMMAQGGLGNLLVPVSFTMSNSYSTGGDTLTLPTSPPMFAGWQLQAVIMLNSSDTTRIYQWTGSATTPKLQAFSALGTEVTAATDLHTTTIQALLYFTA